eukprot:93349_1
MVKDTKKEKSIYKSVVKKKLNLKSKKFKKSKKKSNKNKNKKSKTIHDIGKQKDKDNTDTNNENDSKEEFKGFKSDFQKAMEELTESKKKISELKTTENKSPCL